MNDKWYKRLVGARTIKTGLATFLTALFCMLLNLTPIFAILTAVVTIEPTAKASLKKGYKRLPATVIGALFAVIFTYVFGDQSPLSYAFAATLTILVCTKLNLHAGTTVATLTAVAMIPGIHEAYIFNFFSRLLTAVIGLGTAALVNFIILPPKYYDQLEKLLHDTEEKMYSLYSQRMQELLLSQFKSDTSIKKYNKLIESTQKIESLLSFQSDELSYHRYGEEEWMKFRKFQTLASTDRLFISHLSNIIYLPKKPVIHFDKDEKLAMLKIANNINQIIATGHFEREKQSASLLKNSVKNLDEFDALQLKSHIIYEILLIYRILDDRYA
ncbi:FUSC family protein [Staphylococcus durrellii]|uniref:FUSC family protein n=1 Tax=Staphylococcus durrellii TaxID=2781773 RepID=UPI00189C6DFD|nr:aromatic acid exporter family protein [Staphylococcus durrellii]MBF7016691.1 aromatic acid exporter family protein [Staphylococcus durrellii]